MPFLGRKKYAPSLSYILQHGKQQQQQQGGDRSEGDSKTTPEDGVEHARSSKSSSSGSSSSSANGSASIDGGATADCSSSEEIEIAQLYGGHTEGGYQKHIGGPRVVLEYRIYERPSCS